MSETTTEAPASSDQQPAPAGSVAPPSDDAKPTPPWGDDFKPELAWERIQKQARDIDKLRAAGVLTEDHKAKLAEYDRLAEASKTDTQRANDAAAAAQARVEQLTTRAVMAEVKALAASSFADPTDATAFIDSAKYVTADGEVDTDAIKADLEDLLSRKPHLGKAEPGRRTPAPNPAQGSSASGPSSASQLTKQDVERMAREGKHEEINAARQEGRLNDLLGIKP